FHVPGRWWLRWLLRGLRWIVGLGWPVFPGWRGLYLAHKKKECHSMGGVAHAIEKKLGWVTQGWVVYAGSDLPRRKVTLLAFNQETNREWVIKLADSPSGQGALQQETQALETLARSSVSGHVPTLILPNGSWMGHAFMVQSMLARSYSSQSTTWTPAHREFLQKLKYMDIHLRPMGQTSCWQRVVRGFQTSTTWPDAVRKTYSCLTQDDLLRQEIPCCRSHGDFAPWNIRWEDGKLFVIDWEESEPDGLMIGDLFYFFYCQLGRNPRIRPMDVFLYFNHSMAVMDQKKEIGTQILVLMLRLWLLERFIRSGEIQAMQLLDFFAPDGSPPWKND
ncbi:MAG TPA: hypothetical protein HPQ00_14295, partial [Magnetococcales bacterium]|nr:hypothetical protein [Magnetococcales bacterium]